MSCRHSGEFAVREASVRPMPSASAMSLTVVPEASAFAILVSLPSRRSSAVGDGVAGFTSAEFFRLVMPATSPPSVAPLNEYDFRERTRGGNRASSRTKVNSFAALV
jgi:hypothetical protein